MGDNPRRNGRQDLTRLTLSGGKRTQARLMMAHPMGERKRDPRLAIMLVLAVVVIIAIAGYSGGVR